MFVGLEAIHSEFEEVDLYVVSAPEVLKSMTIESQGIPNSGMLMGGIHNVKK